MLINNRLISSCYLYLYYILTKDVMLSKQEEQTRYDAVRLSLKTTIKQAAKKYNISPRTVKYWKAKLTREGKISLQVSDSFDDNPVSDRKADEKLDCSNEAFIKEAMVVRMELLHQIKKRIEKFRTMKEVLDAFKAINESIMMFSTTDFSGPSTGYRTDMFNIGQQILDNKEELLERQERALKEESRSGQEYSRN